MLTNKVVCINKSHGYQREVFINRAKQVDSELKSEANSSRKTGSTSILGINRFTVCHFLTRNESKANILTQSAWKCGRKWQSKERTDKRFVNIVKVNRRNTLSDISIMYNENTPKEAVKTDCSKKIAWTRISQKSS